MLRTFFFCFAAAAAIGCGSSTSVATSPTDPISLTTHETLTLETSAGGNGLPACPQADGAIYDTKFTINLSTRGVVRTVATVACMGETGHAGELPTTTQTTTVTATTAQITAITNSVQALSVHHVAGCGEDGSLELLTIDHGDGTKDVYDTESGAHCPPVTATVDGDGMSKVLTQASAVF